MYVLSIDLATKSTEIATSRLFVLLLLLVLCGLRQPEKKIYRIGLSCSMYIRWEKLEAKGTDALAECNLKCFDLYETQTHLATK